MVLDVGFFVEKMLYLLCFPGLTLSQEFKQYPSSDKRVNRRPTATCDGNDEERVEWMISPQRRFDRC